MALDTSLYLASRDIALRSGMLATRYRTVDGRYILNDRDLKRVRFTTDEYITGLTGIEKISKREADELIKANGYKFGDDGLNIEDGTSNHQEGIQEEEQEVKTENTEEE